MSRMLYNMGLFKPFIGLFKYILSLTEYFIPYKYKQANNPTISLDTLRKYNQQRSFGPAKIICNAPFKHMYFKQNGNVTACCAGNADAYGNIKKNSIYDIWKGDKALQLRERIQNYNLSGGCKGCQYSLETGNFHAFIGRIYDTILPSFKNDYPEEMTFEISNLCNLECVMCNGEFSNLIRKNVEKLPELQNNYDDSFLKNLQPFLPHLKRVRFMGGEPFLVKEYVSIMNFLVQHNPDCKIYFQTNGTILNQTVKKIIESKNVEISISIDSLQKETYEHIRKNANFERVMENLSYFGNRAKVNNQHINVNFCVMNNNWREVPDMIDFCLQNNFSINIIPVENPRYLSLRICDEEYLNNVLQYSNNFISKIKHTSLFEVYNDFLNHLIALIQICKIKKYKHQHLMQLTIDELYNKSKELFLFVNNLRESDIQSKIFELVFFEIPDLSEEERKIVFCILITDMGNIDKTEIRGIVNSDDELLYKSKKTLSDIKSELRSDIKKTAV